MLIGRFVPTEVIRVRNKDLHWFSDDCVGERLTSSKRLIFGGLVIVLELTGMSLFITRGGQMFWLVAGSVVSVNNMDVLIVAQCPSVHEPPMQRCASNYSGHL